MLCDLMAATGVLGRPASYYRSQSITDWAEKLGVAKNVETGSEEFECAYLTSIRNHGTDASGMFGLRLMWDTVEGLVERLGMIYPDAPSDHALFERAFGQPVYVSLAREDTVAQAVSLVRAKQSGQWHFASDGSVRQGAKAPKPINYDAKAITQELMTIVKDDAAWRAWFESQAISPVEVTYEALSRHPKTVIAGLLEAVGQDPAIAQDVAPATAKTADEESRKWIARYRKEYR
jgi:trehalose 2-sulfotransferase